MGGLMDMLADQRLELLDEAINADAEYRSGRKEQMRLQERLEAMGLSGEQREAAQELLTRANRNSAIYGKMAYEHGFQDGVEFMCELKTKK